MARQASTRRNRGWIAQPVRRLPRVAEMAGMVFAQLIVLSLGLVGLKLSLSCGAFQPYSLGQASPNQTGCEVSPQYYPS